eukprot:c12868_g1_i1 orf=506-2593(-)
MFIMSQARVQVGILVPLKEDNSVDLSIPAIPIYEGFNAVGRGDLAVANKQVSRKHLSVKASSNGAFEIIVEGQNPVILRSENERKKFSPQRKTFLHIGDIVELLPGMHMFKLVAISNEASSAERQTEEGPDVCMSVAFGASDQERVLLKRKRQELGDEAVVRALQAVEDEAISNTCKEGNISRCHVTDGISDKCTKQRQATNDGSTGSKKVKLFSAFRLLRVRGLLNWANADCIGIGDVIQGGVIVAILSNYMVDLDWLLSACPLLKYVPRVVIIHGESGQSLERLKAGKPSSWLLHKPPLPLSYGTHHSKAMILVYPRGVRVIVHTANLIYVDWNCKTQGLWMQDFPYKNEGSGGASPFENDLVEYFEALKWSGCTFDLFGHGSLQVNASFLRKFDYSSASVRLVASVPGYHQGHELKKWGHMKLRTILEEQHFDEDFTHSPLVYQFSSLGSLDEKWLSEFTSSMCAGSTFGGKPLGLGTFQIIWPTVEDVRWSLEGYAAGNAIPSPLKNVEKGFLQKYWAHWEADHTGRSQAMPHIKTFIRYNKQCILWLLLTSSNLSKAAWGALQKNGSQLMIRSYELGVLFLPSMVGRLRNQFSCIDHTTQLGHGLRTLDREAVESHKKEYGYKPVTTMWEGSNDDRHSSNFVHFPVPYRLPPAKYGPQDIPWSWDRKYDQPDAYGELWPRSVQLYGSKEN